MARRCTTENCKREAETYCYHCSNDVCTKHYLEHKKSIQAELPWLTDEVNIFYDCIQRNRKSHRPSAPQCSIDAYNQLEKWRQECHEHIDTVCQRIRSQIEVIVDNYKIEQSQHTTKIIESLEKLRQKVNQLKKDDDVTYRQLETMKQQLDELKRKEKEPNKQSDLRLIAQKIDISKHINIIHEGKCIHEEQPKRRSVRKPSTTPYASRSFSFFIELISFVFQS